MRDREFINRYMAFKVIGLDNYRGDMDDFLALALKKINTMTKKQINELKEVFVNTMDNCALIWGRQTFRKRKPNQSARNVINTALFDEYIKGSLDNACCEDIRQRLFRLFDDGEFNSAISLSTNSLLHISIRFQRSLNMINLIRLRGFKYFTDIKGSSPLLHKQIEAHIQNIFPSFRLDVQMISGTNNTALSFAVHEGVGFVRPQNIGCRSVKSENRPIQADDTVIFFFAGLSDDAVPIIHSPAISKNGSLSEWPNDFFY
jgi:hypothetical protein